MNLTNTRLAQSSRPDLGTTRPPYSSPTRPGQRAPLFDRTVAMMNEISSAALLCRDIHALGQVILDIAVDYIGAHRGSVMLVDETGRLRIIASKGLHLHLLGDFHGKRGEGAPAN